MMQAAIDRPRLRQDLVAEPIEEQAGKFIDVMAPDSGNVFRFYEVEFSIACAMDGERDVAGIVAWAKEELGLSPSMNEVRTVIATLGELGYLDQGPEARAAATDRAAPAAAKPAAHDTDLAPGVVVGAQRKPAPSVDVELGSAGTTAPASGPALPPAPDLDLGAPGAPLAAPKAARPPVSDVALGAPGRIEPPLGTPDVSLDLAVPVRPDDVKEAVRQSKVMAAVEAPKDLIEQAAAPVKAKPVAQPAPAKDEAPKTAAAPAEAPKAAAAPARAEAPMAAAKAEVPKAAAKADAQQAAAAAKTKAAQPAAADKSKPVAPPAPSSGTSPILLVILVLAILGAGAYFAWRYLIQERGPGGETATTAPVTPVAPIAPPQPPAPPSPKSKIEIASGAERDVISVFSGTIESIDPTEREVESSDVLARLVGAKRLETEMAALTKTIDKAILDAANANAALEKAQAANNASAAKAAEAQAAKHDKLRQDKQDQKLEKEDALEKLLVRAPFDGHVVVLAKPGQKLEENTVVAKIVPKPAPSAHFKLEKNMMIERGLAVPVAVGERLVTCTVAESNVDGTRVICPEDPALVEGTEVTLKVEQN